MSRAASKKSIRISPNLQLKPQPNSRFLQAHAAIDGKLYRKSMSTDDVKVARIKAWQWYHSLVTAPVDDDRRLVADWTELAAAYDQSLPAGAKRSYHIPTMKRHFTPFFGSVLDIRHIKPSMIAEYLLYRRKKNPTEPTPQTINRENTILRQMLALAEVKGWIERVPKIPFLAEAQTRRRRRHFTAEEYHTLRSVALQRIRTTKRDERTFGMDLLTRRKLLYDVIQLLANSGLRVDEMKTVTWRCVDFAAGDITLERAGKMKSSRHMILRQPAIRALLRLAARRNRWQRERQQPEVLPPEEPVIAMPDGTAVKQVDTGFDALLKACGFHYTSVLNKHALTSLRHTYATLALTRKRDLRPSVRVLALQMGTSERIITAHYGHEEINDFRRELRG
jgi:integrase